MGELDNPRAALDDYGYQAGTGGQHRFFLVFPTPICVQLRDSSGSQVKRENFRELLDLEWTTGHHETLQKSARMNPVRVINFL